MKVVVANPSWGGGGYGVRSNSRWAHKRKDKVLPYPIYLSYLAAALRTKHEVLGIDAVQQELSTNGLVDKIMAFDADIVILEVSTPSFDYDMETVRQIKRRFNIKVILVGTHCSTRYIEIMEEHPYINYIIRGEFEYAVADLLDNLDKPSQVKSLVYHANNQVKINPKRDPIDLDTLPLPARYIFLIEDYQQGWYQKKTAMMITSRGCPGMCNFCIFPDIMYGHQFRKRSPIKVVDEIEMLVYDYGVKEIDFDDDTFTVDLDHVRQICYEIIDRELDIQWRCFARVSGLDFGLLKLMKEAGCYYLCFGVESGSKEILANAKKGISLKQVEVVVKWCKTLKMKTHATYMFGLSGETHSTVRQTIDFAKKLDTDTVQFSIAMPYPGTRFFKELDDKGYIEYDKWSDFDGTKGSIIRSKEIRKAEFANIVRKAYKEYYFRVSYILRIILSIRSVNDVKYILKGFKIVHKKITR